MTALSYSLAPMEPAERSYVLSTWMRNTRWSRDDIVRRVDAGGVLVAMSDGLVVGWCCVADAHVCFGYVREQYRQFGVARALWVAAGKPARVSPECVASWVMRSSKATRVTARVVSRLAGVPGRVVLGEPERRGG